MQHSDKELREILDQHAKWMRGDGGAHANLFGANLIGAKLAGAKLADANLAGASLRYANLVGADLTGANLIGAKLAGANLTRADLAGADLTGVLLPVSDPRGYTALALRESGNWIIQSGCRRFRIAEAKAHWSAEDYLGAPSIGARYLMALDWLEKHGAPEYLEKYPEPQAVE